MSPREQSGTDTRARPGASVIRALTTAGPAAVTVAVVILVLALMLTTRTFATADNLKVVALGSAVTIVVGLAQMIVISAGGMNLAVGATGGLVSVVCGALMNTYGVPPALAVIAGLAAGAGTGALIGVVIVRGFQPFIVTLAAASVLTGIGLGVTESIPYYHLPDSFEAFGSATVLGVPVIFLVALLLAVILAAMFRYTSFGRQILAFGANPRAAALSGVPLGSLQIAIYALSGFIAAAASVLLVARLGNADPAVGKDWLLVSFAAPIIGGTRLTGGYASVLGTVLGALLLGILVNGLVQWNVNVFFVQLISGLIILGAGGFERVREVVASAGERNERRSA